MYNVLSMAQLRKHARHVSQAAARASHSQISERDIRQDLPTSMERITRF